jgi:chromosome segregation ATPase
MVAHRIATLACLLAGTAPANVQAQLVTPVEKVITLMEDLVKKVETEGSEEATEYDKFACFCKKATKDRSTVIVDKNNDADTLSTSIAAETAEKVTSKEELEAANKKLEQAKLDLAATEEQLAKDKAEFEFNDNDLSKAVYALTNAKKSLEDAKPAAAVLLSLRSSVKQGSDLALALDDKFPETKAKAFLQVDPTSAEYKYHSDGIISTIADLLDEFSAKQTALRSEWTKTKTAAEDAIKAYKNEIGSTETLIDNLKQKIEKLALSIASDREALVMVDAILKDEKVYLRDLTERCETRAKDWDQRSQMRSDELSALNAALDILKNEVKTADDKAGKRSVYVQVAKQGAPRGPVPSFVQTAEVHGHQQKQGVELSQEQKNVVDILSKEGLRLKSQHLTMLAMQLSSSADPFAKVKQLIQDLIERLLKESIAEADKEGFCNEQLAKAKQDRDYRYAEVKTLNVETSELELKSDELDAEIKELTDSIDGLWQDLNTTTTQREKDHDINMQTIADAKDGLEAITSAIVIIKTFYVQAGRAVALVQASPVDEDTKGPGFEGGYGGQQESAKGIIGMMEVIKTDFERTVKVTTEQEKAAQAEFVEFDRVSRTDISGKSKQKDLQSEELKLTLAEIAEKMSTLQNEMNLLDLALKKLLDLKPMCTDFGMSYEDRVKKREEEIAALKKALCALGEPGCV